MYVVRNTCYNNWCFSKNPCFRGKIRSSTTFLALRLLECAGNLDSVYAWKHHLACFFDVMSHTISTCPIEIPAKQVKVITATNESSTSNNSTKLKNRICFLRLQISKSSFMILLERREGNRFQCKLLSQDTFWTLTQVLSTLNQTETCPVRSKIWKENLRNETSLSRNWCSFRNFMRWQHSQRQVDLIDVVYSRRLCKDRDPTLHGLQKYVQKLCFWSILHYNTHCWMIRRLCY